MEAASTAPTTTAEAGGSEEKELSTVAGEEVGVAEEVDVVEVDGEEVEEVEGAVGTPGVEVEEVGERLELIMTLAPVATWGLAEEMATWIGWGGFRVTI